MIRVRFLRIVLTATVLTAAVCSGLTVLQGQPPPNPFRASSADGIPIHFMPTLNVLQDGKVQVIGGDQESTMEMFNAEGEYFTAYAHLVNSTTPLSVVMRAHTRAALIRSSQRSSMQAPVLAGEERDLLDSSLDRSGYTLTEMPQAGFSLAAGGVSSDGVVQGTAVVFDASAAAVTTDKTDYAPGETVIITGAGWQPGETVNMLLHREPKTQPDTTISSVPLISSTLA